MECEWMKEVKKFEESKMGVKGLVDSGITTIPSIFFHPPKNLLDLKPSATHCELPVIDLSADRFEIVNQINDSLSTWGFFQVINHGIPMEVIENTIKAFKLFHEQPVEVKQSYVWDDKVSYRSNLNPSYAKAVNWKDSLRVFTSPDPPELETIPRVCRKELMEWDEYMKGLGENLMEFVCEGLGVASSRLKEVSCLETRYLLCHYYPHCPQPDLTLGIPTHTDRGVLTLLLQNEVSALQVKYGKEWVEVKPIPGAIVVNAGDLLQIFSNDRFQSVEHRVLANSCTESRITVAVLFNPGECGESDMYGPLPELLSSENPVLYRNFSIPEILKQGETDDSSSKPIVNLFKLNVWLNAKRSN